MRKFLIVLLVAITTLFSACESTQQVKDKDPAVVKGANAWNSRGPSSARAFWEEIKESSKKKKYLNYITLYESGLAALDSTDGIKPSNEARYVGACNTALNKFSAIDPLLKLPASTCSKGATATSIAIEKQLASQKLSEGIKMYNTAIKVYGQNKAFDTVTKEVDVCKQINSKRASLLEQAEKAKQIEDFDSKVKAFDAILEKCPAEEAAIANIAKNSGVGDKAAVSANVRGFRTLRQNIAIAKEDAFRSRIYDYKNMIGEEFARQPEGKGSGKNGSYTLAEVLAHYKTIEKNINSIYAELLDFASKHEQDVSQDVIDDVTAQKNDLNRKIAKVNREIAHEKEVASRGKMVVPLMIGLFNAVPGTSGNNKKSRPAKFSATGVKGNDYWWGMVEIKSGQMNDLVITLKDNRTVRVFNKNTKSGKQIEKENLQDLVSRSSRVGNSWPVLNAGKQLNGDLYFFEVQKGKTENYSGEVVVYSSFVTRMR